MAEITFDTAIEHQPPGIGVPEIVRWKVERERRHAQRITIDCRDKSGKFGKVNGFKLDLAKGNDGYPAQECDEICEAVMWCVLQAFLERSAESKEQIAELEFKLTFDQRRPDGERKRPSVEFTFNPDAPDTNRPAGGDDGQIRGEVVGQLLDLVRALTAHLDNAHVRIIESNKGQDAVSKAVSDMMSMMANTYTAGIEMQRRALDYMYNTKRIEEEAVAADRRQERLLKFFEKPVKIALGQFAKFAGKKFKGVMDKDGEATPEGAEESDDVPSAAPGEGGENASAQDENASEEIQFPGADLMRSFGLLILPTQWSKIAEVLTKKEMAVFTGLFEVVTDAQALERWQAIGNGEIAMGKLVKLRDLLSPKQKEMFGALEQVMETIEERGCGPDGAMLPDEAS